jgi:hypothetical protein
MEHIMHMSEKKKKTLGILSFIPLATFLIFVSYLIYIAKPILAERGTYLLHHDVLSTIMSQHYTTLLILSGIAFITGMAMLIYYIIHVARLTHMSAGEKMAWMVFMVTFVGISFPIFWYSEVRHEPDDMPVYPDIA